MHVFRINRVGCLLLRILLQHSRDWTDSDVSDLSSRSDLSPMLLVDSSCASESSNSEREVRPNPHPQARSRPPCPQQPGPSLPM